MNKFGVLMRLNIRNRLAALRGGGLRGESGKMVGFRCDRKDGYVCHYELFDLEKVANFEQKVPASWINAEGNNVTKDFVDYCAPLIQGDANMPFEDGLPRFAQLKRYFV